MRFRRFPSTVLVVAALLAPAACSSGDDESQARPGISQQRAERPAVRLEAVAAELVSPHRRKGPLDDEVRDATMLVLQRTFDATVTDPLRGRRARGIDRLFTEDAAARATGADRGALFDEGLPRVRRLVGERRNVRLTGLAGDDGEPALVVAKIDWDVRSGDGSVRVRRAGELSLIPVLGRWVVGAYTVITTRTVGGTTTTTTAASG